MPAYAALLRNVNLGGFKLPSADLKAMGEAAGFTRVSTFIASGNLLFSSPLPEAEVKRELEARVAAYFGRPAAVFVRTARELAAVTAADPFPQTAGNRKVAIFLDAAPPADALEHARNVGEERFALGVREVYVAYGERMGESRLAIPAATAGTARNLNSVAKLATLTAALE